MGAKIARFLGYSSFFWLCFWASAYLTFPVEVLKPRVAEELTRALNQGRNPGPYGKPGKITIEDMALWRLSGVELRNVTVTETTTEPDAPPPWYIDKMNIRVGVIAYLRKQLAVTFDIRAYEGKIVGDVVLTGEGFKQLKSIDANADGIQWSKMAIVQQKLKVPGEGGLGGEVHLELGKDVKEATGDIKLRGEGLAVGPGELAIPMFGTLTIPRVDMGKLVGDIKVAEGKTSGPPITLTGVDVQGAIDAPLTFKLPYENSQINQGAAALKLSDPFLKANPRFQTVFDLTPMFKNAKSDDGVLRFRLSGAVRHPDAKPDRNAKINVKS